MSANDDNEPEGPATPRKVKPARDELGRIKRGFSGNPSGISKTKQEFLARLTGENAQEIYDAFLNLIRAGNSAAIQLGMAYLCGKPKDTIEIQQVEPEAPHEQPDLSKLSIEELRSLKQLLARAAPDSGDPRPN